MPSEPPTWLSSLRGCFLVFEGADGSGKSTQLRRFVALCMEQHIPICEVREPGGTVVGERIREVLLDKNSTDMTLRAEMLLYMASRAQLVERRIRPALAEKRLVIADRFVTSTYAYQGAAGGLADTEIAAVERVVVQECAPDLVLIFDVDEQTAAKRSGLESATRSKKPDASQSLFADRMEDRDTTFRRKVRESYRAQAIADPARHLLIDARAGPEEVWDEMMQGLKAWATKRT